MMRIYIFYWGSPGNMCKNNEMTADEVGRRRRPTSSAVISSFVQMTSKLEIVD